MRLSAKEPHARFRLSSALLLHHQANRYPPRAQLDDPADLARACRTCRILHYMCLPQLYGHVILRSYDHIRYQEETAKPEGVGGGSPFAMGLNALITRNVVEYVRNFEVAGEWRDYGLEESARAGRIPDGGMMLGLLIRATLDRMPQLESFGWTLNSKMLPNVWAGLATKSRLRSLTIRFPNTRLPSPSQTAPTLPALTYLKITDIDPLCYPDNISELLYHSRKIEYLYLHFSPRMRLEREPSINIHSLFGKVRTSDYRMRLKHFAMQNLYAQNDGNYRDLYVPEIMEEFTLIDSAGGANDDASLSFVSGPPVHLPSMEMLHTLRGNKVSRRHCQIMSKLAKGLRRYFLITGRELRDRPFSLTPPSQAGDVSNPSTPQTLLSPDQQQRTPSVNGATPRSLTDHPTTGAASGTYRRSSSYVASSPGSSNDGPVIALGPFYLETICGSYGRTMTHLLLLPQWRLSEADLHRLSRSCPHMQQVGFATELEPLAALRAIAAAAPRLTAVRLLDFPEGTEVTDAAVAAGTEWYEQRLGVDKLLSDPACRLRWVGIGELVFELASDRTRGVQVEVDGERSWWRHVRRVALKKVRDVDLWSKDRLVI
jgi:hypothetical protein